MGILLWILAGLIAGWLTGKIMKGSGYGFFVDILLGIAERWWAGLSRTTLDWMRTVDSFTAR